MFPHKLFPFDLLKHKAFPGKVGELITGLRHLYMLPPYPWGVWLYCEVLRDKWSKLEGDLAELGVGRGGMSLTLAKVAKAYGKKVYSFDSFEGLPAPGMRDNPYFIEGDYSRAGNAPGLLARFTIEIKRYELEEHVFPVKGFFSDTLKKIPPGSKFCLVHLDSDIYDSIYTSLTEVYDRVVQGGIIVIDDFFHHSQGASRAASDFFNGRKVYPVYHVSFPYSVFIFKGEERKDTELRSLDGNVYSFEWLKRDDYFFNLLESSIRLAKVNNEGLREFQNRLMFLNLIKAEGYKSSHVYTYLRALEDFWDWCSGTNPETRGAIKI